MSVTVDKATLPVKGEKWVWEIEDLFGPIYMRVVRVIVNSPRPRVIFQCQGADEHSYPRTQKLPLPPSMRREDWT